MDQEQVEYGIPDVASNTPVVADDLVPDMDVLDIDQVLVFTQRKRIHVINEINKKLHNIEDPAMISAMLKGLGDMDKAVVQRARIGIEEEALKTDQEQARNSAEILRVVTSNVMRVDPSTLPSREAPKLSNDVPEPALVPGETDTEPGNMSYEAFATGRTGNQAS